jgi:phage FluMu protein Com
MQLKKEVGGQYIKKTADVVDINNTFIEERKPTYIHSSIQHTSFKLLK